MALFFTDKERLHISFNKNGFLTHYDIPFLDLIFKIKKEDECYYSLLYRTLFTALDAFIYYI